VADEHRAEDDPRERAGGDEPPPADDLVTTAHTLDLGSRTLAYHATAGRMVISEEVVKDGTFEGRKPTAQVFVTAYTADDADPLTRPVVFAFNGGPGSSSVWLHLGLFGPRRVDSGDVGNRTPPPYGLLDNTETLLAHADIVFIDPMTTGYSRAVTGGTPADFHGYSGDRDLVGETIRLWLSRNKRWLSPKFLAGESYGTTRAAALAGYLSARHGLAMNGVILISAILDFGSVYFSDGNDAPYVNFLPTYAAIAHYHGKHDGKSLHDVVEEAELFAEGDYAFALSRGSRLSEAERREMAERVGALIGLDPGYVLRSHLRIEHKHFYAELLRDRGLMTGRLDARFTAHPGDIQLAEQDRDPAHAVIHYPYTAAVNHYLRAELGYESDVTYEILTDRVQPWSYKEFENRSVTTAEDLANAIRTNPDLKVYVGFGYYDGATPFAAAERVLALLRIPDEAQGSIMRRYYESGHMMYVHEPSRITQSAHIAEFIDWATGGQPPALEVDRPGKVLGRPDQPSTTTPDATSGATG
jgi:carboxypeptidase C (cathepsin A)